MRLYRKRYGLLVRQTAVLQTLFEIGFDTAYGCVCALCCVLMDVFHQPCCWIVVVGVWFDAQC